MMFSWMLSWHIILCVIAIPFGIQIHKTLFQNIKNEEHLEKGKIVQQIMKNYSVVQCFLWPLSLIISSPFLDMKIFNEIPQTEKFYLVQTSRFISTFLRNFAGFHSLIIAICRYVFIVFTAHADKIGIKTLRIFFISCSIQIPLLLAICEFLFFPAKDWIALFRFSNDSFENVTIQDSSLVHESINSDFDENVVYRTILNYVPQLQISVMRYAVHITAILIYSNIIEGLIYGHIFIFMKRYLNSTMIELTKQCFKFLFSSR